MAAEPETPVFFVKTPLRAARWRPPGRRPLVALGLAALVIVLLVSLVVLKLVRTTPSVTLYRASTQTLNITIGGGGLTKPVQFVNIAYPVPAQVNSVDVQVGQAVTVGTPLITLDAAGLNAQLGQAYQQWQVAQNFITTLQRQGATLAEVANAQEVAGVARSRYDALNAQINSPSFSHGRLLAPLAGVVTGIFITPGSLLTASSTLLTIEDQSSIIVKAQFPLDKRPYVSLGTRAVIEPVATQGQQFTGVVTSIVPALSDAGSDTFEVWMTVPNPDHLLFTGQSVYARVSSREAMVAVPELAVINRDSDAMVFVYQGGRAHLRHVLVGARDGDRIGIINGIAPNDRVILVGQHQLSDGDQVVVAQN